MKKAIIGSIEDNRKFWHDTNLKHIMSAFLITPPEFEFAERLLKKEDYSSGEISQLAFNYVNKLLEPKADKIFFGLSNEEEEKRNILIQQKRRSYMFDVMELLLRYNLDPNYVSNGVSLLSKICRVDIDNMSSFEDPTADTLKLLLENGGNPDTRSKVGNLFDEVDYINRFGRFPDNRDGIINTKTYHHCWLIVVGFGGHSGKSSEAPLFDLGTDYDEPFKPSNLKNFYEYTIVRTAATQNSTAGYGIINFSPDVETVARITGWR